MDEPTIVVGEVTRAHGVRGEVAVRNRSDNPERWLPGTIVRAPDGSALTVAAVRTHGGKLLVTFEQIADRNAAETLRGAELRVPLTDLPPLAEGEWWPHDLEGCRIFTESGRDLGTLTEVVFNPANDLWVARDEAGTETLVPALRSLLVDVDIAARRIVVRDVPGLTTPEAQP
ncbi:MAG: ribosome maturation factor RimM [Actinomycetota bacterium]